MFFRVVITAVLSTLLLGCSQTFDNELNVYSEAEPESSVNVGAGYDTLDELLTAGKGFYQAQCASCHGPKGSGNPGTSTLKSIHDDSFTHATITTMPPTNAGQCGQSCAQAILAWVATENDINIDIQFSNGSGQEPEEPNQVPSEPSSGTGTPSASLTTLADINRGILQEECVLCHVSNSVARNSDLVFVTGTDSIALVENNQQLLDYVTANGVSAILQKASAQVKHIGGEALPTSDARYNDFERFLSQLALMANHEMGGEPSNTIETQPPMMPMPNDDDGDGVDNDKDMFPTNPDRVEEQGFLYQRWENISVATMDDSKVAAALTTASDVEEIILGDLTSPSAQGNNYIVRMVTVFTPTQSGSFKFFTAADDMVDVYFGESESMKKRIIRQTSWTNSNQFFKHSHQASATLELTAGKMYYIEMVGAENGGGDHFSLGWASPSATKDSDVTILPADMLQLHIAGDAPSAEGKGESSNDVELKTVETFLSDLNWSNATVGWDDVEKDRANSKNPLRINGETYTKGIGTHAPSEITYNLNGEYTRFKTSLGMDDGSNTGNGQGSVVFEVYVDNARVYTSGTMNHNELKSIDLDITNANILKLVVTDAGDGKNYDHANFVNAILESSDTDSMNNDASDMNNTDAGDKSESSETDNDKSDEDSAEPTLIEKVNSIVLQDKCIACHKTGGFADKTRLTLTAGESLSIAMANVNQLMTITNEENGDFVLSKVRGEDHRGGKVHGTGTAEYQLLAEFFELLANDESETNNPDSSIEDSDESKKSGSEIQLLSLNKPSEQNSTGFGGVASKGNDGDLNSNNWAHSSRSSSAVLHEWWLVDIEEKMHIDHVVFHPRPGFERRLNGGYIAISEKDLTNVDLSLAKSDSDVHVFKIKDVSGQTKLMTSKDGQFIKVYGPIGEPLNFTELQVMGYDSGIVELDREEPEIQYSQLGERCEASRTIEPVLRRLTRNELIATVNHAFPQLGGDWLASDLAADLKTEIGFDNDVDLVSGSIAFVDQWARTSEALADELLDNHYSKTVPCRGDGAACAQTQLMTILTSLARKAVDQSDVNDIVSFWNEAYELSGNDEKVAWRWALVAALQHPSVIYRQEIPMAGSANGSISGRDIADAIAFTYSGKPADAELLALADSGALFEPQTRVAQATRLLQTEAGEEQILRFFRIWLKTDKVVDNPKADVENFAELSHMMTEEVERLVRKVIIDNNGTAGELLNTHTTFVNKELADYYGMSHPNGADWLEVSDSERGGYLRSGAFLAGNSLPDSSSPTQRGMMIYRRLLCNDVPPALAEIPSLDIITDESLTTREKWVLEHTADASCQSCHDNFDPIGFSLENYDEFGLFRATEKGKTVDASGRIPDDFGGIQINGAEDLVGLLANDERVAHCMSGFMNHWTFAGAGGQTCLAEDSRSKLASGEYSVMEYFAALAGEANFVQRIVP